METRNVLSVTPFHVSVVCVFLGFDGESFHVLIEDLLMQRGLHSVRRQSLPGGIVGLSEDLEDSAKRVFRKYGEGYEPKLKQFKVFGSVERCKNTIDKVALDDMLGEIKVERLLCVAYVATTRISSELEKESESNRSKWYPVDSLPNLCFDHCEIVDNAIYSLKSRVKSEPEFVYDLLGAEFTAAELRRLMESIVGKKLDVRNFYKKLESRSYLVPTNKKQMNVAHRAARFYRFDKSIYKKKFEDMY